MGSVIQEGSMPLSKPKPRKATPRNIVAATHAERISDGKMLYCVLDNKSTLWCKAYGEEQWFAYQYDLGCKTREYFELIGSGINQGSLF